MPRMTANASDNERTRGGSLVGGGACEEEEASAWRRRRREVAKAWVRAPPSRIMPGAARAYVCLIAGLLIFCSVPVLSFSFLWRGGRRSEAKAKAGRPSLTKP